MFAYLGPPSRKLFSAVSRSKRLKSRSAGVVLCNPFGEEAVRAHRSYRMLASHLARSGFDVLRFDFSCTGDSPGEAEDATLDAWLADITQASDNLREVAGCKNVVLVGLRLGATLAALATSRRELVPRHLVLWDPVVDGGSYLRSLRTAHEAYMTAELGAHVWSPTHSPDGGMTEALGSPITAGLANDLGAIDLPAERLRAQHVSVISTSSDEPRLDALRQRIEALPNAKWIPLTTRTPWNSDEVLNSQLVPMDIIERVIERVEEVSP